MVVTAVVAAAATYTAVTVKNQADEQKRQQEKALEQQKLANQQAKEQAAAEAQRAEIEYNKASQKQPYVEQIIANSEQASKSGSSSTVLTGSNRAVDQKMGNKGSGGGSLLTGQIGVDPSSLNLGGNTLLGS